VYTAVLADQERQQVEQYLMAKYGLDEPARSLDPQSVTGLELWLRADDADSVVRNGSNNVSAWINQVDDGPDAIAATGLQPVWQDDQSELGGLPAIHFDGANDVLSLVDDYAAGSPSAEEITVARTVFLVVKHDTANANDHTILGDGTADDFAGGDGAALFDSSAAICDADSVGYVNGVEQSSVGAMTKPAAFELVALQSSNDLTLDRIGSDRNITGHYWDGQVAEVLVYSQWLTPRDREGIETYLMSKYGLAPDDEQPVIAITIPTGNQWSPDVNDDITVEADVTVEAGSISTVKFFIYYEDGTAVDSGTAGAPTGDTYSCLFDWSARGPGVYQLVVVATTTTGIQSTASAAMTVPGGSVSAISGLTLWLRADSDVRTAASVAVVDGDLVGEWDNQVSAQPNARSTNFNQPRWEAAAANGQPAIHFDATSDPGQTAAEDWIWLVHPTQGQPNRISDILTAVIVIRHDTGFGDGQTVLGDSSYDDFAGGDGELLFDGSSAAASCTAYVNGRPIDASEIRKPTTLQVVTLVSSAPDYLHCDQLGRDGSDATSHWDGHVAEVLAFNVALSDADRRHVEGYLIEKYGLNGPTVVATAPADGSKVPLPTQDNPLVLTALVKNAKSIAILDRFGNDITDEATLLPAGLEMGIAFDPNAVDPAELSGIRHEYILELTDWENQKHQTSIAFEIDATLPTVEASVLGRRVFEPFDVTLAASEDGATIYYTTDGLPPTTDDAQYSQPISIEPGEDAKTIVLQFVAVDAAGNIGPVGREVYFFGELPAPVDGFTAGYFADDDQVQMSWQAWQAPAGAGPIGGYHLYKAVNPLDVAILNDSREHGYNPPAGLRITDQPQLLADTDAVDDGPVLGVTAWYGVTVVDDTGTQSVISPLVAVALTSDADSGAADADEAIERAVQWLIANQNERGYWGDKEGTRLLVTSQVLNALERLEDLGGQYVGWKQAHAHMLQRGVLYLRSRAARDNDTLARIIDTLQRFGQDTTSLHVRLLSQARFDDNDVIAGWGLHGRYHADGYHTALALAAKGPDPNFTQLYGAYKAAADASIDDTFRAVLRDNDLQAASQASAYDTWGWVPMGPRRVFVSAFVYRALDDCGQYSIWWDDWMMDSTYPDVLPNDSVLDTAAILLWWRSVEFTTNDLTTARQDLADAQLLNGSWQDRAMLTGFCLEALVASDE